MITGVEPVVEPSLRGDSPGVFSLSGRSGGTSDVGDLHSSPCCSRTRMCFSYDVWESTKAGSGGMMNVVALGTGTKSMMSLWLLNPAALARCLCLLRLTKKMMNPIVQASRTQAPETDPAMIGVLAFSLDHPKQRTLPVSAYSSGTVELGTGNGRNTHTHGEQQPLKGFRFDVVELVVCS